MQKLCDVVFSVIVMFGASTVALAVTNFVSSTQSNQKVTA
jgi:hypothetical protein